MNHKNAYQRLRKRPLYKILGLLSKRISEDAVRSLYDHLWDEMKQLGSLPRRTRQQRQRLGRMQLDHVVFCRRLLELRHQRKRR